jgi:hypothetical protein
MSSVTLSRKTPRGMNFIGEAQMAPCGKPTHTAQSDDTYMTLNKRTMSPEYDTLAVSFSLEKNFDDLRVSHNNISFLPKCAHVPQV